MRDVMHETHYGVLDEGLLRSALARPRQAAEHERAGGLRQAAYLFHGLSTNHGFPQGNKRTAYLALEWFLAKNGLGRIAASDEQIIDLCYRTLDEHWGIDQIESWLAECVAPCDGD